MARRDTLLTAQKATKQFDEDSKMLTFGYDTADLAAYFRISEQEATALHRIVAGRPTADDAAILRNWQAETYEAPEQYSQKNNRLEATEWGLNHLAQHPKGSRYKGDFKEKVLNNPLTRGLAAFATGGYSEYARAGYIANEKAKQGKGGAAAGAILSAATQTGAAGGVSLDAAQSYQAALQPEPPKLPATPAVQPLASPDASPAISPRRRKNSTLLTGSQGVPDDENIGRPTLLGGNFKTLGR
jgi:hypothetical protein